MTIDQRRAEFFALMAHAVRIGELLPEHVEDVDMHDPAVRDELKAILREFGAAIRAIETFLP